METLVPFLSCWNTSPAAPFFVLFLPTPSIHAFTTLLPHTPPLLLLLDWIWTSPSKSFCNKRTTTGRKEKEVRQSIFLFFYCKTSILGFFFLRFRCFWERCKVIKTSRLGFPDYESCWLIHIFFSKSNILLFYIWALVMLVVSYWYKLTNMSWAVNITFLFVGVLCFW